MRIRIIFYIRANEGRSRHHSQPIDLRFRRTTLALRSQEALDKSGVRLGRGPKRGGSEKMPLPLSPVPEREELRTLTHTAFPSAGMVTSHATRLSSLVWNARSIRHAPIHAGMPCIINRLPDRTRCSHNRRRLY